MAEDRDEKKFKPFGYFLVTWLLLIYAGRRECFPGTSQTPVSSDTPNTPGYFAVPPSDDPENEGA
jgi:hypothetical protein